MQWIFKVRKMSNVIYLLEFDREMFSAEFFVELGQNLGLFFFFPFDFSGVFAITKLNLKTKRILDQFTAVILLHHDDKMQIIIQCQICVTIPSLSKLNILNAALGRSIHFDFIAKCRLHFSFKFLNQDPAGISSNKARSGKDQ